MDAVAVVIRDFDLDHDRAFLFSSWRNSAFYHALTPKNKREAPEWFKAQSAKIKEILKKATVKIACLQDAPDVIVGYSVFTGPHLDWVYVKNDYREMGIGSLLLPPGLETATSDLTKIGVVFIEKKNLKIKGEQKNGQTKEPRPERTDDSLGAGPA